MGVHTSVISIDKSVEALGICLAYVRAKPPSPQVLVNLEQVLEGVIGACTPALAGGL
jgi:hypothetical protein